MRVRVAIDKCVCVCEVERLFYNMNVLVLIEDEREEDY